MTATSTRFKNKKAPCGRMVDGEHYQAEDQQGLMTDEVSHACGCRETREEYHDGSIHRRVVRHDGRVLVDEVSSEHGA